MNHRCLHDCPDRYPVERTSSWARLTPLGTWPFTAHPSRAAGVRKPSFCSSPSDSVGRVAPSPPRPAHFKLLASKTRNSASGVPYPFMRQNTQRIAVWLAGGSGYLRLLDLLVGLDGEEEEIGEGVVDDYAVVTKVPIAVDHLRQPDS